ncbi:MAG: PAS domain-containing sensor histidine kinase [Comamonas sp.]|nr:PAS domain-containing sensor histidine kinase [Candidatus Comamonas equi]
MPGTLHGSWLLTTLYLMVAALGWLVLRHKPPAQRWGWPWLLLLGADIACICLMQEIQPGKMHYTPLLALPILTIAVLGPMRMALATTAGITLILLGADIARAWREDALGSENFMQTALVCTGFFAVAYLTRQLAQRLGYQERQARQHRQAASMQAQVNSLIIDHLSEGVLVLDAQYQVRMANPAACDLLGLPQPLALQTLQDHAAWQPLRNMVDYSFAHSQPHCSHVHLISAEQAPVGLYVRTWLTSHLNTPWMAPSLDPDTGGESQLLPQTWLCVMFLNDLREVEARIRTEKMAAMGRMSAAVAHEIRNPLAAILQANALLAEELAQPAHQRLSQMVEHNAQRLARIAEDVLDIARVQQQIQHAASDVLALDTELASIWKDWQQQAPAARSGVFMPGAPQAHIAFDSEHLRRVAINLLDNASRYRTAHADGLQLITGAASKVRFWMQVWSEGPPLEASVQKHLFEPFFSSQSRSTGLGLYICRELCQRHGGTISYQRAQRMTERGLQLGNMFTVQFVGSAQPASNASLFDPLVV